MRLKVNFLIFNFNYSIGITCNSNNMTAEAIGPYFRNLVSIKCGFDWYNYEKSFLKSSWWRGKTQPIRYSPLQVASTYENTWAWSLGPWLQAEKRNQLVLPLWATCYEWRRTGLWFYWTPSNWLGLQKEWVFNIIFNQSTY